MAFFFLLLRVVGASQSEKIKLRTGKEGVRYMLASEGWETPNYEIWCDMFLGLLVRGSVRKVTFPSPSKKKVPCHVL